MVTAVGLAGVDDDFLLMLAAAEVVEVMGRLIAKPLLREGGPPPTFRMGPERKPAPPCGREEDGLLLEVFMAMVGVFFYLLYLMLMVFVVLQMQAVTSYRVRLSHETTNCNTRNMM